jgi:predicted DNA-binding transcriptional regulator AlpA
MTRAYNGDMSRTVKLDDLVDAHAVAEAIGLSMASNVSLYQKRYPDMPRPVLNLGKGRPCLWLQSEITKWAKQTGRTS